MYIKLVILAKLEKRINSILKVFKLKRNIDFNIRLLPPSFLTIKILQNFSLDMIEKIDKSIKNEFGDVVEIKKSIQYGFIFKIKELKEIRTEKLNLLLND